MQMIRIDAESLQNLHNLIVSSQEASERRGRRQ